MSYIPNQQAFTSAEGVNSSNTISGSLWVGNVFTGAGEQNDFTYVGVNLQTDEAGTLTLQFSQNGTDWSSYPTQEFTVVAGINEVHGAWKGTRYVRPKFTGIDGSRTYFRIRTMYSYDVIALSAPLNQPISADSDATIVRSVSIGEDPTSTYVNQKADGSGYLTTGSLGPAGVYDSGVLDLRGFTQVQTCITSDVDGTIDIYFLADAAGTDIARTLTIPYVASNGFQLYSGPAFTPYVKYTYTNGSVGQSDFFYETKFLTKALSGQLLTVDAFISPSMVANLGRNIIVGQDNAGNFRNAKISALGNAQVEVKNPLTAFGEVRTAELTPVVQTSFVYGINTDLILTSSFGTGTITTGSALVSVHTGASTNSSASISTIKPLKYNAGQGATSRFTALFTEGVEGNNQFVGSFDDNNGYKFGYSGSSFGVCRTQNGVDFFTSQSAWNIDKMDGSSNISNPTGQLLDTTKGNVYEIKFQYLGFGSIIYSVEDSVTGLIVPVHNEQYANNNTVPSVFNPTLPIRAFTENTTNSTDVSVKCGSFSGFVEGKRELVGPINSTFNSKNPQTSEQTITIRNKTEFRGIPNQVRAYIQIFSFSSQVSGQSGDPVSIEVIKNATFGSGLTYANISIDSVIEVSTTNSTISGGKPILNTSLAPTDSNIVVAPDKFIYEIDPGDTISIKASGTNPGFSAGFTWVEDF